MPDSLRSLAKTASWISELTGEDSASVRERLREEFERPGTNVARSFKEAGLKRYSWSDDLIRFYETTDAFLYELVIWNRNRIKRQMRRWVAKRVGNLGGESCEVLSIGDGLGFDSLHLAQSGHRVTYFEVPGYSESFARRVFDEAGESITVLTDPSEIPQGRFDVVVCLDVLEHVPDPPGMVASIASYLREGGLLIVHAPFYMIHPANPTHLEANRRYSGSLSLYQKQNFRLIDGAPGWNPLALRKMGNGVPAPPLFDPKVIGLKLGGLFLKLGRLSMLPFFWVDAKRRSKGEWFEH